jgi:hypothetical protein
MNRSPMRLDEINKKDRKKKQVRTMLSEKRIK